MAGIVRPLLVIMTMLLLGGGAGLFLGETTVEAMQVRRVPEAAAITVNEGSIAQGRRWAQAHYPADADTCPSPTLLFQWGCVMSSSN